MRATSHCLLPLLLAAALTTFHPACSSESDEQKDSFGKELIWNPSYDTGPTRPDEDIVVPNDQEYWPETGELTDASPTGSEVDVPEVGDFTGPEETSGPDEVEPDLDIMEDDEEEGPIDYPYEVFGPMTISMKGIILGGQYLQMRFAEVSYWKLPHDRWDAILEMVREAGFNGIYTSACWRYHQPVQNESDFETGNLALAEFLQKVQAKGFYIYFAAGPWIDGEPGGCLPDWVLVDGNNQPSAAADGKMAIRLTDADFQSATYSYLDQLNAIVSAYQVTSFPEGKITFYQIESNYDVFYFLKDAAARVSQEMLGVPLSPVNPGLYLAQLRDTVKADGITVPIVTAITGDFENGGRRVIGTGDAPGILPVFSMTTNSEYESMELKLWTLRKEMRKASLHGQVFMAVPGIAVGLVPSPAHMARMLMAGADAVVVKDFAASLQPLDRAPVGLNRRGLRIFSQLADARLAISSNLRDPASPVTLAGIPRRSFFAFKQLNFLMERLHTGFAGRDLPRRTGPNKTSSPITLEVTNPAVGAIENKFKWPAAGAAGGVMELMGDYFQEWYQTPSEPVGRATYFFDSADGTILVHLLSLDELKNGENKHDRQDLVTKLKLNGSEIPRHSSIVVPKSDDLATGEGALGWGSKLILLNHPLGPGYPMLEYASSNLISIREVNGRLLIVAHGKPIVKSAGVFFTEPGEISFTQFGGIPDVVHNSLPGGGIFTDAGGKLAIQFQHDSTGYLVLSLPGGKQLLLMTTTSDLAETIHFEKRFDGSDVAILGFDQVESLQDGPDGLVINGRMRPSMDRFVVLTSTAPYEVEVNGETVTCLFDEMAQALACTFTPAPLPPEDLSHGDLYMRSESYFGTPGELGVDEHPEQFAAITGAPVPLNDPAVDGDFGVAWYVADQQLGAIQPTMEGFLMAEGAADLVSLFVNGTYLGTAVAAGNTPMTATDVTMGLPTAGFRVPAGVLTQGSNNLAFRVLSLGHATASMPLLHSIAPLLPPELDPLASTIPHLAVEGLAATCPKGVWGQVKLTVGAISAPVIGPWTISRGNETGLTQTFGILQNWHAIPPTPEAPNNYGFSWIPQVSKDDPLLLVDGQMTWLTTTFSTQQLTGAGSLELELGGRSLVGLVFLNGHPVGHWASDEESLGQGLYSKLVQGSGTRQVFADREFGHFYSDSPDRVVLPAHYLNTEENALNRVTVWLLDISPALAADLVLPSLGTIAGEGRLERFALHPNREGLSSSNQEADAAVLWRDMQLSLLPPPPPEE